MPSRYEKTMRFCSNCGAEIDARAKICPKCGVEQVPIIEKMWRNIMIATGVVELISRLIAWWFVKREERKIMERLWERMAVTARKWAMGAEKVAAELAMLESRENNLL